MVVIFDRFYMEEAYSFFIHNQLPNAAIVLDMQDMHSLRWHRQSIIENRVAKKADEDADEDDPLANLPLSFPLANDEKLNRELASICRSDLTLVCSPVEMEALRTLYRIPNEKLCLASFFLDQPTLSQVKTESFHHRRDYAFIGGFRHPPNVDAVRQIKRLWQDIRMELGDNTVNFQVYGPFFPLALEEQYHKPSEGFQVHGFAESVDDVLSKCRVMLAPLRFGAGIKGKIIDSWLADTPVVTTPVGCEGMHLPTSPDAMVPDHWGGRVVNNSQDFVKAAVSLYKEEHTWEQARLKGRDIISDLYSPHHWNTVLAKLIDVCQNLETRRHADFTRSLLWHQTARSTEYFSKWIEMKNQK